ncbi:MAG: YaiI/YqxD family protein [Gammaproteobacteria bacterium]|nr:YaiI/YqxD family protein [Gammaproteobacteria bacterium]
MDIWVDADACPGAIKEILFRAARRTGLQLTLVANHALPVPPQPNIRMLQVSSGFDVADDEIVRLTKPGDLVITGDIPLAAQVIEKGATVLNVRGERLTADNIKPKLNMRDFMDTMRSSGVQSGGPAPLNNQDKQQFANQLDRLLAQIQR